MTSKVASYHVNTTIDVDSINTRAHPFLHFLLKIMLIFLTKVKNINISYDHTIMQKIEYATIR